MILVCCALENESVGFQMRREEMLLVTGVGKVNAAISLSSNILFANYNIQAVVNLGTAGAADRYIGRIIKPYIFIDGSNYPVELSDHYPNVSFCSKESEFACFTNDEFKTHPSAGSIYDMEAYALARACQLKGINFYCYKIISDSGNILEWNKNLKSSMEKLWHFYYENVYSRLNASIWANDNKGIR